jgi:uncharacterized protein
MESKTAYYSDTGNIDDLIAFVARNPDSLLIPEHGLEGGRTLLHIAASYGSVEVCKELIRLGISINASASSSGGKLPIGEAAGRGHVNLVSWLIEHGSLIDGPPEATTSPLMDSSIGGHLDVVNLLLQHDVDVNRLHLKYNQTSLDLALVYKQDEIADVLRNAGWRQAVEPIDFSVKGSGILEHIEDRVGDILSIRQRMKVGDSEVEFATAMMREVKDCKLFFSFGVHQVVPHAEYFFCLQSDWPLNRAALAGNSAYSFPILALAELARRRLNGDLVSEGNVFEKESLPFPEKFWPDDVDAIVLIDYQFDHAEPKERVVGEVTMLAVVPVKYTKSGRPTGKKLDDLVIKLRTSSWKKISLKIPLKN